MKFQNLFLSILGIFFIAQIPLHAQKTIVDKYGQLSVKGKYLMSEQGDTVQLRGMSLFWSQWMGQYYNAACLKTLRDEWKCTIVRAAMGVEMGGYLTNPDLEKEKICKVVDASIELGIYVVIDFHSHEAHKHPEAAKKFFSEMAEKYGKYPNVLYEIYNEPLKEPTWSGDIKPYADTIIKAIRKLDPDNIIVVGTRQWSQLVHEASLDPIQGNNIMYALHFYAHSHREDLRKEALKAMNNNIALFVTEWGSCNSSGNGNFNPEETKKWLDFMDQHKLSWCNWSIADKNETASALSPGASANGSWPEEMLTSSGKLIKAELILKNTPILEMKNKRTNKK